MREMDHRLDDYFVQHKDIVIRNICLYVDYHTAEDLCQETFIRLQKYLDRVKPAEIVSWLIVVSEHLAMDHLKKGGQYTTVPGLNMADAELLEFCSDPAEIVLEREDSRKRLRVLERLRRERWDWYDVLMLYYVGRMTDGEISREKGIRRSLAAQWRKRAQDWLREMYKEEETEGEQYQ